MLLLIAADAVAIGLLTLLGKKLEIPALVHELGIAALGLTLVEMLRSGEPTTTGPTVRPHMRGENEGGWL